METNPLFPALRSSPTAVQETPAKSKFLAVKLEPSTTPKGLESVIVRLELTASSELFEKKAEEIRRNESAVDIILAPTVKSNGCIGHPDDGLEFQNQVNGLLHKIAASSRH